MVGKVGDRIVVESEKVGTKVREGVILEVVEHAYGVEYRVRWDDEHESRIRPAAGSAHFVAPADSRKR